MEFKFTLGQMVTAALSTVSYILIVLGLAWRISRRVANIEHRVELALEQVTESNDRMEKTFAKIDRTFERMDDKIEDRRRKGG